VDEAGFAPQPPNRSAWSKVGETHAVVSKRSQRLNVIGALLSSGRLMMAKLWHSVTGLWCFGFLMALIERVKKPMVVILDNASIHTGPSSFRVERDIHNDSWSSSPVGMWAGCI